MRFVCPCFLLFSLSVGSSNPSRTNNCCYWTPKHVLETNSTLRRKTDYRRGVKFSFCFTENEANEGGKKGGKQAGTTDPYGNKRKKRGCKFRKLQQLKRKKRRGGVGGGGSTRKKKKKKRKRKSQLSKRRRKEGESTRQQERKRKGMGEKKQIKPNKHQSKNNSKRK